MFLGEQAHRSALHPLVFPVTLHLLFFLCVSVSLCAFLVTSGKESACHAGDTGLIPGSGRPSGKEKGNPLQYSCLENPMDRGAWQVIDDGVARESDTT